MAANCPSVSVALEIALGVFLMFVLAGSVKVMELLVILQLIRMMHYCVSRVSVLLAQHLSFQNRCAKFSANVTSLICTNSFAAACTCVACVAVK